jgi:hypothetical protein
LLIQSQWIISSKTDGGDGMAQLSNLIVNGVTRLLSKLYVSDSVTAPNFIGKLTGTAAKLGRNGDADTPMTFNWSGKDGQPTWLWGGENGSDMYVYNPSNFSVKNAKAAGSSDSATKLSSSAGSATQPVYFSDGKPVATTYTLGKSVPASAVFTDTNTWRGVQNNLTSDATDQSLSAAQGKVLKGLVDGKAAASHTHSQYYDSTISRTKGTVLAAPASANGVATFRTLTKSDVGLSSVDNTADSAKSVKYATSAGSAGSATKANCVADYNATSKSIQIGYSGDGITGDAIKYIAGYTTGDGGDVSAKIKDISKDALKGWIGSLPANGGNSTTVNGHSINSDVPAGAKFTDTNTWRGIQDNLTSGSTTDSLSANQGKVLKGLIDGKAASGHTHNYAGSSSSGGAATSANKVNAALTINLNGTSQGAWDGSSAKSISITAASVGATSVTISRW